jgi:pimeloyl-ACP methyl ester carboxylesterase
MHAVLEAAEIPPPYFLVGSSAGGVITFMFAQAYAKHVAGFVVVNPMPPPCTANAEAAREVHEQANGRGERAARLPR